MRTPRSALTAAVFAGAMIVGSCSSSDSQVEVSDATASVEEAEQQTTAAPTAEPTATPTPEPTLTVVAPVDAAAAAEALREASPDITGVTVYDENTDPNDLIGRPGQYTSAAQITDARAAGGDGIDAGAVVEVFATPEDAQARSTYIQETLTDLGPAFGTEWHHLQGTHLLRVSGTLVPSVNDEYAAAWTTLFPVG
jgi:hypothetical protein